MAAYQLFYFKEFRIDLAKAILKTKMAFTEANLEL